MAENKVLEFVADFAKPEVISPVRRQALDALNGMDFPHRRIEEWKYTRVAKYVKRKYNQQSATAEAGKYEVKGMKAHKLVFVNGYFDEQQSTIIENDELTVDMIATLNEDYYTDLMEDIQENVFSIINKAYETGGVFINVPANKKVAFPVHIIHVLKGEGVIANVRHFVRIGQGSKAEMVVTFDSEDAKDSFTNVVIEGHVEENAHLSINKIQSEDKDVLHISREFFVQEKDSYFKINTITTGGDLTRNQLDVLVEGKNCYTEMNGAYLGTEKQHIDNHTFVDQTESFCTTNELYKGVMDDKSTGVFNGMILVRPDAQKIAAYQSNKNILVSPTATINSKPELEIYADDVRCSHGSTIGDLDPAGIFYLRTRGIDEDKAKHLMISAFIGDVLDKIENESVRKKIDEHFFEEFGWEF